VCVCVCVCVFYEKVIIIITNTHDNRIVYARVYTVPNVSIGYVLGLCDTCTVGRLPIKTRVSVPFSRSSRAKSAAREIKSIDVLL